MSASRMMTTMAVAGRTDRPEYRPWWRGLRAPCSPPGPRGTLRYERSIAGGCVRASHWASLRLIDSCTSLSREQLSTSIPGTYGSILETMRHLVGADAYYLFVLTGGRVSMIDEETMELGELRAATQASGAAGSDLLAQDLAPDTDVVRRRDDGSEAHAPLGVRLAQALHHGTDHRSQICMALTNLGLEPPDIDVWAFAEQGGRFREVPGPS